VFLCPNDQSTLMRHDAHDYIYWACPSCQGRTATLAQLRHPALAATGESRAVVNPEFADHLWALARSSGGEGSKKCPACERPMTTVSLPGNPAALELDVCRRCYFVWFDRGEFAALPPASSSSNTAADALPLEARLMMAKLDVEALDTRPDLKLPPEEPPAEAWKQIPAFFGLPVEQDHHAFAHLPQAAWGLAAIVAIFSLISFLDLGDAARDLGVVPSKILRYGGLTLLTSFFLHGSLPHLAGNLYFLAAFGSNVEDYLGSGRFLLLLLVSTVAGSALYAWSHPASAIPLIGASGAVSGMLTCYALQFPRARIGLLIRLPQFFFMRWVQMRAWLYILFWISLQALGAWRQAGSFVQVSPLAHLGGAAAGFLFWFFIPKSNGSAAPASSTQSASTNESS
jgi:membrane associated rhomboid family serine protease